MPYIGTGVSIFGMRVLKISFFLVQKYHKNELKLINNFEISLFPK